MISVCIATYNGADYIAEQLQSILPQLSKEDEIVISDDCSTDNTADIVARFRDERIRFLPAKEKLGSTNNFFRAIDASKGEILFLADQDDVWLPGRVERCVKELETADLVVTDCRVVDNELKMLYPSLFRLYGLHEGLWHNLLRCGFYGSLMAMRRSVVERARPWPKNELLKHDWWLGMVAEKTGKVRFLSDKQYVLYRRHEGTETQVSANPFKRSKRSLKTKLLARLCMAREIQKIQ